MNETKVPMSGPAVGGMVDQTGAGALSRYAPVAAGSERPTQVTRRFTIVPC